MSEPVSGSGSGWEQWAAVIGGALTGAAASQRESTGYAPGVGPAGYVQYPDANAQQYNQQNAKPDYAKWALIGGGLLVAVVVLKKLL